MKTTKTISQIKNLLEKLLTEAKKIKLKRLSNSKTREFTDQINDFLDSFSPAEDNSPEQATTIKQLQQTLQEKLTLETTLAEKDSQIANLEQQISKLSSSEDAKLATTEQKLTKVNTQLINAEPELKSNNLPKQDKENNDDIVQELAQTQRSKRNLWIGSPIAVVLAGLLYPTIVYLRNNKSKNHGSDNTRTFNKSETKYGSN
jgi:hypothetical protein